MDGDTGTSVEEAIRSSAALSCTSLNLARRQLTTIPDDLLKLRQLEVRENAFSQFLEGSYVGGIHK